MVIDITKDDVHWYDRSFICWGTQLQARQEWTGEDYHVCYQNLSEYPAAFLVEKTLKGDTYKLGWRVGKRWGCIYTNRSGLDGSFGQLLGWFLLLVVTMIDFLFLICMRVFFIIFFHTLWKLSMIFLSKGRTADHSMVINLIHLARYKSKVFAGTCVTCKSIGCPWKFHTCGMPLW